MDRHQKVYNFGYMDVAWKIEISQNVMTISRGKLDELVFIPSYVFIIPTEIFQKMIWFYLTTKLKSIFKRGFL